MAITQSSYLTEIPVMDTILKTQAEQLAREMATQVTTLDDLNGLMRAMMKTALERMLHTEMDVHLGRRTEPAGTNTPTPNTEATHAPPKNRRASASFTTTTGSLPGASAPVNVRPSRRGMPSVSK